MKNVYFFKLGVLAIEFNFKPYLIVYEYLKPFYKEVMGLFNLYLWLIQYLHNQKKCFRVLFKKLIRWRDNHYDSRDVHFCVECGIIITIDSIKDFNAKVTSKARSIDVLYYCCCLSFSDDHAQHAHYRARDAHSCLHVHGMSIGVLFSHHASEKLLQRQ